MDPFILVVGGLLLLIGTPIALMWWKLARKAAPYADEQRGAATTPKGADSETIDLSRGDSKRSN